MNRKWKSGYRGMALGFLAFSLLTGCSKDKVDYDIQDTQGSGESEKMEGSVFEDNGTRWQTSIKTQGADGKEYNIRIDAEITTPETEEMKVIEIEEADFADAQYQESIFSTLFGNAPVYRHEDEFRTREELEEEIAFCENRLNYFADCRKNGGGYDESDEKAAEERLQMCKSLLSSAGADWVQADSPDGREYLALRDGIAYTVTFEEEDSHEGQFRQETDEGLSVISAGLTTRWKDISIQPADLTSVCPEQLKDTYRIYIQEAGNLFGDEDTNLCSLNMEQAQQKAEEFLESIGLHYMEVTKSDHMEWQGSLKQQEVYQKVWYLDVDFRLAYDGYVFYFDLCLDGIGLNSFGNEQLYESSLPASEGELSSAVVNRAKVYVTDEGVIQAEISNPIVVKSVTALSKMLSTNDIKDILCKELTQNPQEYLISEWRDKTPIVNLSASYDSLELIYFRVADKKESGVYSYVPAWRLSSKQGSIGMENTIILNALDGSVIRLQDEFRVGKNWPIR